jgi:phospholipase C
MKSIVKYILVLASIGTALVHAQIASFKHVVIIFQENRTPDNLFQGLCTTASACSITPTGKQYNIQTKDWKDKTSPGKIIQPMPVVLANTYDLSHAHSAWVAECDKDTSGTCLMDGAAGVSCSGTCLTQPQFRFATGDSTAGYTLQPYLDLATQYGWANYMFQTNEGPSYPAHQYIFGATSALNAADDASGLFLAENPCAPNGTTGKCLNVNPPYKAGGDTGCLAPLGELNFQIDSTGTETVIANNPLGTFCYPRHSLAKLIDNAGHTWKYYGPTSKNGNGANPGGSIWMAPDSISEICVPDPAFTTCTGSEWNNNVVLNPAQVLTDIANTSCVLADVTWVIPSGLNSDHANGNNGGGPAWVASIVNAIGNSWANSGHKCDYWGANSPGNETAIFITWDDWGGWYDHVPPKILPSPQGGYQLGFRVPLLAVSAYTPMQTVNNNHHDFASVLRFVEQNYSLGNLGFADTRCDPMWVNCATDTLRAFFDYQGTPRSFTTLTARHGAKYFINDKTPPTDPDDD